ncbi:MAG: hypothetical protein VR65_28020 [Desulfobulbaceae bacterium BRH_c16a]|nr:MAG: hypothetical protein VR65_28020 [Desulfobulbaceae bacterium BRH_c16a]
MTYAKYINILLFSIFTLLQASQGISIASTEEPKTSETCVECNDKTGISIAQAKIGSISFKAEMLKIDTEKESYLVKFTDETLLTGADSLRDLMIGQEITIKYHDEGGSLFADSIDVMKQQSDTETTTFITVGELAKLLEQGPQDGTSTLIDSRIESQYDEGHIPGAISLYDGKMKKQPDLLPKDKNGLLVFYCGGTA